MPERELWSAAQVADHFGWTSTATARKTLSRWGVQAVDYQRGDGGRPEARYDTAEVLHAAERRPGRGSRTDLQ
jgi:hypothetical protein